MFVKLFIELIFTCSSMAAGILSNYKRFFVSLCMDP